MSERFRAIVAAIVTVITLLGAMYEIFRGGPATEPAFGAIGFLFGYWFR